MDRQTILAWLIVGGTAVLMIYSVLKPRDPEGGCGCGKGKKSCL